MLIRMLTDAFGGRFGAVADSRLQGEKPFECKRCDKRFSLKHNAVEHERIHRGDQPHSCTFCDKRFSRKSNAVVHERTHSGEKPYECTVCAKQFRTSSDARRHKSTQHGIDADGMPIADDDADDDSDGNAPSDGTP